MLSKHAKHRMQQRAIPPLMVDLLYRYGREQQQRGSTVIFFDKRSRERARKALEDMTRRFDKLSDAYLVEADDSGQTITVGHRMRRLRNR